MKIATKQYSNVNYKDMSIDKISTIDISKDYKTEPCKGCGNKKK